MEKLLSIVVTLSLLVFFALLVAFPTMWLWNYLMPDLFGLKSINFIQALSINLFCRILIKGGSSSSKD